MNDQALLPIKKGDNFLIGPYHFVCMGWEHGRIKATRYEPGVGLIAHSLSVDVALSPMFRMLKKQVEVIST